MKSRRVTRFVSVGVFNTLFDFTLLNILVFGFGVYRIWANVVSTLAAMSVSYLLNHSFVFRHDSTKNSRQFVLFLSVTLFGLLVLQNAIIYLLTHQLSWIADGIYNLIVQPLFGETFSLEFIQLNFAKAVATVVTMIWNYQLYKRVVFPEKNDAPATD